MDYQTKSLLELRSTQDPTPLAIVVMRLVYLRVK